MFELENFRGNENRQVTQPRDHAAATENYSLLLGYISYPLGESNRQRHEYNVKVPRLHNTVLEHVPMLSFAGRNNIGWRPPTPQVGDPVLVLSVHGARSHNYILGGIQLNGPIGDLLKEEKVYGIDELHQIVQTFINQQSIQPNLVAAGFDASVYAQPVTLRPISPVTGNAVGAAVQGSVRIADALSNDYEVRLGGQATQPQQNSVSNGEGFKIGLHDGAPTQNALKDVYRALKEQELVQAVYAIASGGVWQRTDVVQPHLSVAEVNRYDHGVARGFLRGARQKLQLAQEQERLQREFVERNLVTPYRILLETWGELGGLGLDVRGQLRALPTYIPPRARYEGIDPGTPRLRPYNRTLSYNLDYPSGGGNPERVDALLTVLPLVSEGKLALGRGGPETALAQLDVTRLLPEQLGPLTRVIDVLVGQTGDRWAGAVAEAVSGFLAGLPRELSQAVSAYVGDQVRELLRPYLGEVSRQVGEALAGVLQTQQVQQVLSWVGQAQRYEQWIRQTLPQLGPQVGQAAVQVVGDLLQGRPPSPQRLQQLADRWQAQLRLPGGRP
jgi:hypothetical protein